MMLPDEDANGLDEERARTEAGRLAGALKPRVDRDQANPPGAGMLHEHRHGRGWTRGQREGAHIKMTR